MLQRSNALGVKVFASLNWGLMWTVGLCGTVLGLLCSRCEAHWRNRMSFSLSLFISIYMNGPTVVFISQGKEMQ